MSAIEHPLSETIAEVRSALPPLVPDAALARIDALAGQLPAALTEQVYFECRLSGARQQVDVMMKVADEGIVILGDRDVRQSLPRRLAQTPVWRQLASLVRAGLPGAAAGAVRAIWLEFDLPPDESFGGLARPRLFIELSRAWIEAASPAVVAATTCRLVRAAGATAAAVEPVLRRTAGRLLAVGCSPASPGSPLRLCLATPGGTSRLLPEIASGEQADSPELELLSSLALPTVTHLDLDVEGRCLPGRGVELAFDRRAQLWGPPRETGLLARIAALGLCRPEDASGVGAWSGHAVTTLSHQIWPSLVVRRLNHLKLRVEAGRLSEAKAYFCFTHRPWRRSLGNSRHTLCVRSEVGRAP
jgi:hypothetical protein